MAVEEWILGGVGLLGVIEAATYMTVQYVRSKFPWLITKKR